MTRTRLCIIALSAGLLSLCLHVPHGAPDPASLATPTASFHPLVVRAKAETVLPPPDVAAGDLRAARAQVVSRSAQRRKADAGPETTALGIRGALVFPNGEPAPDVELFFMRQEFGDGPRLDQAPTAPDDATVVSGFDGTFSTPVLQPGTYDVWPCNRDNDVRLGELVYEGEHGWEVSAGDEVRLRLSLCRVEIGAIDQEGVPLSEPHFSARTAGDASQLRSDAAAPRFWGSPGEELHVLIQENEHQPTATRFRFDANQPDTRLDVAILSKSAYSGLQLDLRTAEGDLPIRDALLRIASPDGLSVDLGRRQSWVPVRSDGRVVLPPGRWKVSVLADPIPGEGWLAGEFFPIEEELELVAGEFQRRTLRFHRGTRIELAPLTHHDLLLRGFCGNANRRDYTFEVQLEGKSDVRRDQLWRHSFTGDVTQEYQTLSLPAPVGKRPSTWFSNELYMPGAYRVRIRIERAKSGFDLVGEELIVLTADPLPAPIPFPLELIEAEDEP